MTKQEKIELSKRVAEKYGINAFVVEHEYIIPAPLYLYQDIARTMELAIENDIWVLPYDNLKKVMAKHRPSIRTADESYKDHPSKKEAVLVAVLRALEAKE